MKSLFLCAVVAAAMALSSRSDAAMIFTEGFNSSTLPADWTTQLVAGTAASIDFVSSSTHPAGFVPYEGSYFVRFNSYTAGVGQQIRLARKTAFSTRGFNRVMAEFAWTHDTQYAGNLDAVTVQVSTNGADWVDVTTVTRPGASNQWQRQTLLLPLMAQNQDTVFIAFRFTSMYGNDCHLDYLRVAGYAAAPGLSLWSQLPDVSDNGYASQLATNFPFDARMADDVRFDTPTKPIKYMQWFFYTDPTVTNIYAWNIYVYDHDTTSNAPGTVLWQWRNIPAGQCHEATNLFDAYTRSYWAELPAALTMLTGQHFWITFQPSLDFPPQSYWLATPQAVRLSTGALQFALISISNWTAMSDCAFELLADPGLLVPALSWQRVVPGTTVAHTLTLTNTTGLLDTFGLTVLGAWPIAPLPPSVTLAAGAATSFTVSVSCPDGTPLEIVENTRVTAVSLANPALSNQAQLFSMTYRECPGLPVWTQEPDLYNGIISTLVTNPSGTEARCADDFLFGAPLADPILYLRWWDARFALVKPEAWNIYLYNHDPALSVPTNEISVWHIDGSNVYWSKLNLDIFYECWTELPLPFTPATGQHYWMTVQAEIPAGNPNTYWAMRSAEVSLCTGVWRSTTFGVTNWTIYPGIPYDFAFEFRVVPEPALTVAGLLTLGAAARCAARRRRRE
ncbi:MAG: hypothetical protein NTV22_17845 [bacterium]|nr:hypothetical protein [bacterium]